MEAELNADIRDKKAVNNTNGNTLSKSDRNSLDLSENGVVHSKLLAEAELIAKSMENEVKIDMEKIPNPSITSDPDVVDNKPNILLDPSVTVEIPLDEECEFSQEKDAPEVSTRVYDFNMVKQKTLPRINFSMNNGILGGLGANHSRIYVFTWILMGVSLAICAAVVFWYWLTML